MDCCGWTWSKEKVCFLASGLDAAEEEEPGVGAVTAEEEPAGVEEGSTVTADSEPWTT